MHKSVMLIVWMCLGTFLAAPASAQDKPTSVVEGQANVNRCQAGSHQVAFAMPDGWVSDSAAAAQLGACAVLVPTGSTLQTTRKVILILFQQKDPGNRDFANLKNYADANLKAMKSRFKGLKSEVRQVDGRDPKGASYIAYEVSGKSGPSPSLYMYVDASDGFYTVSATMLTFDELSSLDIKQFFSTLTVL